MKDENKEWLKNIKIAHRGLHNKFIKENTLSAFSKAIEEKVAIELDVLLTKDNKVLVMHDENMKRMTGISRLVSNHMLEDIQILRILDTKETMPSLKEVLSLVSGQVPVLIEIKDTENQLKLNEEVLKLINEYEGKVAVQSFNKETVRWFQKASPSILRGLIMEGENKDNIDLEEILSLSTNFISYNIDNIEDEIVNDLRTTCPILTWTVNTKEKEEKSIGKVDNIIYEMH